MTPDRLDDLFMLVGSMSAKLDQALAKTTAHETRITKLEGDRLRLTGIVAGVTMALSWFAHDKLPWLVSALTK